LLLTVPDTSLLLPTILSRIQLIPMQLLTTPQIQCALVERWGVDPKEAELIAALAAGRIGWAVQAVEDEEMLEERKTQMEQLAKLPTMSKVQRFDFVQRLSVDADKVRDVLELWLLWWRDMVLAVNGCLDLTVNVDMRDLLRMQANKLDSTEAVRIIRAILQTMEALDQNVNARVAFEVLMLEIPALKT